jgi:hypothetical protein
VLHDDGRWHSVSFGGCWAFEDLAQEAKFQIKYLP